MTETAQRSLLDRSTLLLIPLSISGSYRVRAEINGQSNRLFLCEVSFRIGKQITLCIQSGKVINENELLDWKLFPLLENCPLGGRTRKGIKRLSHSTQISNLLAAGNRHLNQLNIKNLNFSIE